MDDHAASSAALTIAFAAAAGIVSQSVARSLRMPGIVVLLVVGALLGPDVAGLIRPASLGPALPHLVGFAVAVILFEGGLNLHFDEFRKQNRTIRRLIGFGALVTTIGGMLAAKLLLGWSWRVSALFGTLVIVTGPTVVTPLVRRFKLTKTVGTILEAEGVLIDAVGAITAVIALEVALHPSGLVAAKGAVDIAIRLGLGVGFGLVGGGIFWLMLRYRFLVALGLENVTTLALVWALYQGSDALLHESGIPAVTVAGMVVGNLKIPRRRVLLEFNDQLTVMLIGMLFVLLTAGVRVADVAALGWNGIGVVALLILAVRPVTVFLASAGSPLTSREKLYVAWLGPRGIIAAAVASIFADRLARAGIAGGAELRALVFLVIAITVVLAGATGGVVAKVLGVASPPRGWLFLGANPVAVRLGKVLQEAGDEVTCIDSSADCCSEAESYGLEVVRGNGLEPETLHSASVELRAGVAAVTPNDEVNLLFIKRAHEEGRVHTRLAALRSATEGATTEMVHDEGGHVLFGSDYDMDVWSARIRTETAAIELWTANDGASLPVHDDAARVLLPLAHHRGPQVTPMDDGKRLEEGDDGTFVLDRNHLDEARRYLEGAGWRPAG